jgi:uncharacterized protein (TIRG00374 family)
MEAEIIAESKSVGKRGLWYGALVSSKWRMLLGLAGIAIGFALLVHLIHATNFSGVPATISRVGILGIAIILIPYSIAAMLDTYAWRKLLTSKNRVPSFRTIFRVRTATEALVITVPLGSIVSDPAKAWMLKRQLGFPLSTTAASIVFRKTMLGFSQGIVGMFVAVIALLNPGSFRSAGIGEGLAWTLLVFASAVVVIYGLFLGLLCNTAFVDRFHRWLTRLPFARLAKWFERKEPQFREFNGHLQSFRDIRSVIRFSSIYATIWLTENIETLTILFLLGANLTVPQALVMEVTCVLMRASTPMVPGGIGIQDTGYVSMIMACGNSSEIAAAFVLIKRFRELLWAALGYLLLLNARRSNTSMESPRLAVTASEV